MNPIKTFIRQNERIDSFIKRLSIIYFSLFQFAVVAIVALLIWYPGSDYMESEKRIYIILLVFLSWLLKFIIFDLDIPHPFQYKNPALRKKLIGLQNHLLGAIKFLNKTPIPKHPRKMKMSALPCYLLMGPENAGKTSLLKNAGIHFILQKQTQQKDAASNQCDWWVTREASMIDVPGKYLSTEIKGYSTLWMFFLRLMKKIRGKNGVNGIIIALPAPEIIQQNDNKNYDNLIRDLFKGIQDVQKIFARPVTCYLVITKCDLLPGFKEFFAETSTEEAAQSLGITLPQPKEGENIADLFTARFNALIKNVNQQLLWRLHQERNPMARPAIKDFPLQMERLKEFTADFIKKLSIIRLRISLQGVYLSSALQPEMVEKDINDPSVDTTTRVIQIFKEPTASSRAYFVKQFFTVALHHAHETHKTTMSVDRMKTRLAYAASAGCIVLSAVILGKDFQQGVKQSASLALHVADYQHKIANMHNPADHLINTIHLLDNLQQSTTKTSFRFDLSYLLSIYSNQSQGQAIKTYQSALHQLLLPEIRNYFEEYLDNPVNKNADDVYSVLKAYLMMGNAIRFDAAHVTETLQKILSKTIQENESQSLMTHLKTQLDSPFIPVPLDIKKIELSRQYLNGLPSLKLSYIILRNIDNNNIGSGIRIQNGNDAPIFANQHLASEIPLMFTAKMFSAVFNQHINIAVKESYSGNTVLGINPQFNPAEIDKTLVDQLRIQYVAKYIDTWENLLTNIRLTPPVDLAATDAMIANIISNDSPLLHLLKTVHDNTNFEPVIVSSQRLARINSLMKTDESQKTLYTIFAGMESLHQYLQNILHAENIRQAAFDAVSNRMSGKNPDAITQLRVIAENCPAPIRQWLVKITDNSWNYIMQTAGQYLDISWNTQVIPYYRNEIVGHYPFSLQSQKEISIGKFTAFFGNRGIITDFYNKYLQRFVDTSTTDWHWKQIDGKSVPFSMETLRQIQYAIRIHHSFFPNENNKLHVQFALKPYKFGKMIKAVMIHMNDEQFIDDNDTGDTHKITLGENDKSEMTSIQLMQNDHQVINRQFKGSWGWFKLLNQSFESVITKKEMLLNLSMNEHPAKYILSTEGQYNPFLSLNLQLFHLPQQLTDDKA